MENADEIDGGRNFADGNPGSDADPSASGADPASPPSPSPSPPSRAPFTSLSQVDADLVLARALQEQERAYMMLMLNGAVGGSHHGSSESGSFEDDELDGDDVVNAIGEDGHGVSDEEIDYEGDEDAFDANEDGVDAVEFESDEAFAKALQEEEERQVAERLMAMAGLGHWGAGEGEENGSNHQDEWEDVDPDELSYEELVALGEVVGTESRGLAADTIASLPSDNYKAQSSSDGNTDQCIICHIDFEDGEPLVSLPCKHMYHPECINMWLGINKVCPVCSTEVSAPSSMQD